MPDVVWGGGVVAVWRPQSGGGHAAALFQCGGVLGAVRLRSSAQCKGPPPQTPAGLLRGPLACGLAHWVECRPPACLPGQMGGKSDRQKKVCVPQIGLRPRAPFMNFSLFPEDNCSDLGRWGGSDGVK